MSQPYVGEIRIFGGNFAPSGWAFCDGTLIAIADNDVLFALIGTTYGGDGQTTFALPDLRGRLPLHQGTGASNYVIGQSGGQEFVGLTTTQISPHVHAPVASAQTATQTSPSGNLVAQLPAGSIYTDVATDQAANAAAVAATGGNLPHDNFQPYLCLSFIISLFGVFPSQN